MSKYRMGQKNENMIGNRGNRSEQWSNCNVFDINMILSKEKIKYLTKIIYPIRSKLEIEGTVI